MLAKKDAFCIEMILFHGIHAFNFLKSDSKCKFQFS